MKRVEKNKEIKNRKFKKIKNIIEYTIIFLIILVNGILIVKSVNNPNKTPDLFGKKAFIIVSGSMIPTIEIGDIVVIDNTTDVKENDVIAFRRNTTVIVHRIIDEMNVNGKVMYQTKGDNNNIADLELVEVEDIEGVYQAKIPYIGKILMFLYKNLSIVIVIVIVILLIKYLLN